MYISRQFYPGILKQLHCHNRCHKSALHISRAKAVKPAVLHGWRVRRRIPLIFISCRHGINMTVKHQAPAVFVSFENSIHIIAVIVIMSDVSFLIFVQAFFNGFLCHRIPADDIRSHILEQFHHILLPRLFQPPCYPMAQIMGVDSYKVHQTLYICLFIFFQNFF